MTNSIHDVATPYQWARSVAAQLPTSTLLAYDGTGHGTYRLSSCVRAAVDTYLLTLHTPATGTHCPAEWPTTGDAGPALRNRDPSRTGSPADTWTRRSKTLECAIGQFSVTGKAGFLDDHRPSVVLAAQPAAAPPTTL